MVLRVDQDAAKDSFANSAANDSSAHSSFAAAPPLAGKSAQAGAAAAAPASAPSPERRINLRPLASLLPYIGRYRGRALAALGALVVAAITTSIGMLQLPPVVISTPLKILLFVMVDGWNLLVGSLMKSFT